MTRTRPQIESNAQQWDECRRCPEFNSCYQMSMAKVALENWVASNF
ncbi:hypothetical protein RSSM_01744 [Rhodopirellula sallentina SM41]|uniref:Uncharacterized protein n=1 Tax=Rhodopirellula sallentina SM41 TaxID=1263870 RepID=M5UG37_9BACT|nr:hypothetical protein RSSM_01744 [Rhodopirellula sallentina SM41]